MRSWTELSLRRPSKLATDFLWHLAVTYSLWPKFSSSGSRSNQISLQNCFKDELRFIMPRNIINTQKSLRNINRHFFWATLVLFWKQFKVFNSCLSAPDLILQSLHQISQVILLLWLFAPRLFLQIYWVAKYGLRTALYPPWVFLGSNKQTNDQTYKTVLGHSVTSVLRWV